ncbi:hypothetical protein cypCar_00019129 [Cyprinus carpio]|nr:hypothetical protein cypCar_00019129 [Cyprinus carpio]
MLNGSREGLFELGRQLQQEGDSQAALHCFLSCLLGLTHVQSFHSLPNCLHQIAELYIDDKNWPFQLELFECGLFPKRICGHLSWESSAVYSGGEDVLRSGIDRAHLTAGQHRQVHFLLDLLKCFFYGAVEGTWSQEDGPLGTSGCLSQEELSEQATQAQDLERLAQLCIMSKRPHLALEYSGKATKIHQRAFGNDHPITARSLELLATVYAEIGKTEYTSLTNQEVINEKLPTSILKRSNMSNVESDLLRKRKTERRVRFREPEITVHVYDTPQSRLHLTLLTCLFLLLSALGLALYCTDRRRPQRACEELQTALAVYLLQFKQIVWACWIWLTMQ